MSRCCPRSFPISSTIARSATIGAGRAGQMIALLPLFGAVAGRPAAARRTAAHLRHLWGMACIVAGIVLAAISPGGSAPSDLDDAPVDQAAGGIEDRLRRRARPPAEHFERMIRADRARPPEFAGDLADARIDDSAISLITKSGMTRLGNFRASGPSRSRRISPTSRIIMNGPAPINRSFATPGATRARTCRSARSRTSTTAKPSRG